MLLTTSVLQLLQLCIILPLASPNTIINVSIKADASFRVLRPVNQDHEVRLEMKSPFNLKIMIWGSEQPDRLYYIDSSYRDRVHYRGGDFIQLRNVTLNDNGRYKIIIRDILGNTESHWFDLHVFDPVSQPMVEMASDCSVNVSLSCSVSKGTNATIYWRKRLEPNVTFDGYVLLLNPGSVEQAAEYECVAENPISQEISRPQQPCPENPGQDHIWLIPSVILVLLLLTILFCLWKKRKRTTQDKLAVI